MQHYPTLSTATKFRLEQSKCAHHFLLLLLLLFSSLSPSLSPSLSRTLAPSSHQHHPSPPPSPHSSPTPHHRYNPLHCHFEHTFTTSHTIRSSKAQTSRFHRFFALLPCSHTLSPRPHPNSLPRPLTVASSSLLSTSLLYESVCVLTTDLVSPVDPSCHERKRSFG